MKRAFAIALGLAAAANPTLASAQATSPDITARAKGPPGAVVGTLIYISAQLSRDETWVYEPATGSVTACCRGTSVPEGPPLTRKAGSAGSSAASVPQEAVKPIKGIGIVVKKNGPPYPTYRVTAPATGPVPTDAVSPVKGVGVVIKRNPGSTTERALPTATDGSATFDGALAPGTYDVSVALPAEAEAGIPVPISLTFRIIVAPDGTATSAYRSRKGYQYYLAKSDINAR
jgi:hypothetical protein